jgi:hypothetical protein
MKAAVAYLKATSRNLGKGTDSPYGILRPESNHILNAKQGCQPRCDDLYYQSV